MLIFEEGGNPENKEKTPPSKDGNQQTQPTWRRVRESNPRHIVGRWALPPLRHPYSPKECRLDCRLDSWLDCGTSLLHWFGHPTAGAKTNNIIAIPFRVCIHFVSICYVILDLYGGYFHCFRHFGVFLGLVFHSDLYLRKKGMKSWLEWYFFGLGKSKSMCIQDDLFFTSCTVDPNSISVFLCLFESFRRNLNEAK